MPASLARHLATLSCVLTCLTLTACGGGGAEPEGTAGPLDAAADGSAHILASPSREDSTAAALTTNASVIGNSLAMGDSATLYLQGVPEMPTPAAFQASDAQGRTFYVNSSTGNDSYTGRAAAPGSANAGPWRTLARLLQSGLAAGDTVELACGSTWRETLRLPASGTAARPIRVRAPAAGCATLPAIDGSVTIASTAWAKHTGAIYKTPLTTPPLAVYTTVGAMTEAHHPNRGHLASDPSSVFAALAGNGNVVTTNGRPGSTQLTTGADLALPSGTNLAGARVRVRTHAWLIDESAITAHSGNRITLATPTSYPVTAGWGYFLLGQLWMLDSAGEWAYDTVAKQLYAWLPPSRGLATVNVSTLALGIDLNDRSNVVVDGLAVRRVGMAVTARQTQNIVLRNSRIEDTTSNGIDATDSAGVTIESNAFVRIGTNGVLCEDENRGRCTGMTVRGNVMREIGMVMENEQVVSLPGPSHAAIRNGFSGTIARNTLVNVNHTGVRPGAFTVVEDNFIFGACSVLDDCAAIYAWSDKNITIRRNTILRSRGALAGKPPSDYFTQAQGIYLDEHTNNTLIEGNTVMDSDNGIQLHVSPNNTIRNNVLYGNRTSQLWMQENSRTHNPNGDLYGNVVTGNQFAAVYPGSTALRLDTAYTTTANFGTFDYNRYYERATPAQVFVRTTPAGSGTLTLAQWRSSQGIGSTQPVDVNGSGVGEGGYAEFTRSGGNAVPNGNIAQGLGGWTSWNATLPKGTLTAGSCSGMNCLTYRAGGSAGLISSPSFSLTQGTWYRMTVDLAAELPSQWLQIVLRRNGGAGDSAYEMLVTRKLVVTAGQAWGRYSIIFQATKSATPAGLLDGARVDIEGVEPGRALSIANLEVVPLSRTSVAQVSSVHVNVSGSASPMACPAAMVSAGVCGKLANLANDQFVVWPVGLPAVGGTILYGQDAGLSDSDLDGVPNSQDQCPSTPPGAVVNAAGCSFSQQR